MDRKMINQTIIFFIVLFGWTVVILLAGPK
jgi:hypothetical protein